MILGSIDTSFTVRMWEMCDTCMEALRSTDVKHLFLFGTEPMDYGENGAAITHLFWEIRISPQCREYFHFSAAFVSFLSLNNYFFY